MYPQVFTAVLTVGFCTFNTSQEGAILRDPNPKQQVKYFLLQLSNQHTPLTKVAIWFQLPAMCPFHLNTTIKTRVLVYLPWKHFQIMSREAILLLLRHRDTKAENHHIYCLCLFDESQKWLEIKNRDAREILLQISKQYTFVIGVGFWVGILLH